MKRTKPTLVRTIQMLSIIPFALLAAVISISHIISHNRIAEQRAKKMRTDYVAQQKTKIKREIERVVNMVKTFRTRNNKKLNALIKSRAHAAHAIAQHLHITYSKLKTAAEVQRLIVNALRPLRFRRGTGYNFIVQPDGLVVLHADRPHLEGKRTQNNKLLSIANSSPEGFVKYECTRPGGKKALFTKRSYVIRFKPYNWIIVTGLYADDIEADLKKDLLRAISKIRFGKEGYVFVNRLNGDALASNGKLATSIKKLWELSSKDSEKVKKIFALEYQAALKPNGDYIYYTWEKLSTAKSKSPKASFIHGIPEFSWLVGAGVYLDDVEATISKLQRASTNKLRKELLIILALTVGFITLLLFIVHRTSLYLLDDVKLFASFLKSAAQSDIEIDTSNIRFEELTNIGMNANIMLADKIGAQEKVLREKEQLAVTLRSIGDGVITTDLDGRIVLINRITEDLTGWTQREARGRPVEDVYKNVNELTGEASVNPVTTVLATGKMTDLESHTALISRDGTQRTIEDSAAPIFDKEKKVTGVVLVYRDVTDERRTAQELVKVKKLESVGVLAGGLAHDFNNILGGILGNIELAIDATQKDTTVQTLLVDAQKASLRAVGITQQLLTFAQGGDPVKKSASLYNIIVDASSFVLHGGSADCVYDIPDDLWSVDIDSGQIGQVIQNISLNAREAMEAGGTLTISCQNISEAQAEGTLCSGSRCVQISLSDTGQGIPARHLDAVFDPYFTTKDSGSGLGLAICHSIVRKHGGHLTVESPKSGGTTFSVCLPASSQQQDRLEPPKSRVSKSERKATVLVLDDERLIRTVARRVLEQAGHNVILAEHGREAIELYVDHFGGETPIDLIIMDLTIPGGMGGEETIGEILKINADAKVIVASGYSNAPVMSNFEFYGFKASITKPYRMKDLTDLVNSLLQRES